MAELQSSNVSTAPPLPPLQLFESPEAENEFLEWETTADPAEVERFRSILGKPSQFVGRVTSLELARAHWQQWAVWQATEGAALEEQRRNAMKEAKAEAPPASPDEIEAARKRWHEAVAWGKQNEREWFEWRRAELARINSIYKDAEESRRRHIETARESYRRLR